jgi:hypothetical protein
MEVPMYAMWTIVKPNGDKLALMDESEAVEQATELSKQAGNNIIKLLASTTYEEEDGDEDHPAGTEWVTHEAHLQNGESVKAINVDYEMDTRVAPGKSRAKKGLSAEEKAAKEAAKAEKKAIKDAEKLEKAVARTLAKEERDRIKVEKRAQRELDKANRPARGPRSKLPDDGIVHMLRGSNPKRPGTACYPRFDLYNDGMTVKEYKEVNPNFGSADLAWDIEHGFIKVTNADGSELVGPEPIVAPEAPELQAAAE